MGHLPSSKSHVYILVCVDYVTKWVEVIACTANDSYIISNFLKNDYFTMHGVPRVLINDEGLNYETSIWKVRLQNIM